VWWLGHQTCKVVIDRLQFGVPAAPLHVTALGKLFTHTHVPLFTSSINWYRHKLGAKQALHTTLALVHIVAASAGVRLSATETKISTALWALVAWEDSSLV